MGIRHFPSSLAAAFVASALLGIVSCQTRPDGYWTNPNRSQALANQEYPADSKECQALVASDTFSKTQSYKARLFTQCMQAKGYQWVVEPQGARSLNPDAQRSPLSMEHCSKGRLTIDAFGYHKCVPVGGREGGALEENHHPTIPSQFPSQDRAEARARPASQPHDARARDDESCRQHAKESLSSTYSVYSQCMREKGWALQPQP
jgi:hypothetical protein